MNTNDIRRMGCAVSGGFGQICFECASELIVFIGSLASMKGLRTLFLSGFIFVVLV